MTFEELQNLEIPYQISKHGQMIFDWTYKPAEHPVHVMENLLHYAARRFEDPTAAKAAKVVTNKDTGVKSLVPLIIPDRAPTTLEKNRMIWLGTIRLRDIYKRLLDGTLGLKGDKVRVPSEVKSFRLYLDNQKLQTLDDCEIECKSQGKVFADMRAAIAILEKGKAPKDEEPDDAS